MHPPATVPVALNSYALWVALMIGLTVTNYGYPILQSGAGRRHLGAGRLCGSAVMSTRDLFTFRNPHFATGVGVTAAMLVVTAIAGFIVLPFAQPGLQFASVWDAICSAAGVPQRAANVDGARADTNVSPRSC